jgi:hypothetical protein
METNRGILEKAPTYIWEKWNAVNNTPLEFLPNLLDDENRRKYQEWLKRWYIRG